MNTQALAALIAAPRHVNPAVELWLDLWQKGPLSAEELIHASPQIEQAIQEGESEAEHVKASLHGLVISKPIPSSTVPTGF